MTEELITITKTDLALIVKCKCGGTVAATMIYGGVSIDEDFTDTIASVYNNGGKVELVSTKTVRVTLDGCHCKTQMLAHVPAGILA